MNDISYVICYCDNITGESKWQTFSSMDEITEFVENNKNYILPEYKVFDNKNDIASSQEKMKNNYMGYCYTYGMHPDWIGKTFHDTKKNKDVILIGLKPNNRKYNIIVKDVNTDKSYKMTVDYFKETYEQIS